MADLIEVGLLREILTNEAVGIFVETPMKKEKITIITPTFNSSSYIKEAIHSVISQSYADWELIIIDDCSTDGTVEIIESFMLSDERIRLIKNQENKGAAFSRNVGILKSEGDYLAF